MSTNSDIRCVCGHRKRDHFSVNIGVPLPVFFPVYRCTACSCWEFKAEIRVSENETLRSGFPPDEVTALKIAIRQDTSFVPRHLYKLPIGYPALAVPMIMHVKEEFHEDSSKFAQLNDVIVRFPTGLLNLTRAKCVTWDPGRKPELYDELLWRPLRHGEQITITGTHEGK